MDGAAPLVLLVQRVEPDEVLLRVGRNLRGGPGDDKVAGDGAPVTFAKLGEAEEKQTVLLLRPRDALAALLVAGLRRGRLAALLLGGLVAAVRAARGGLLRGRGSRGNRGVNLHGCDDTLGVQDAVLVLVVGKRHAAGFDVLDVLLEEVEPALEANHGLAGVVGVDLAPHVLAVEVANLGEGGLEVLVLIDADGWKQREEEGSVEGISLSVKNLGTEEKLPRREISPRGGGGALTSSGRTG